jgi:hypothetical protein
MLRIAKLVLICVPLALAACQSEPSNDTALQAQIAAANQKADEALATAQQALSAAQAANARGNQQYNRSLQK